MSNHARRHTPRHARPPKIDPVALRLGIELDSRLRGCNCDYSVDHDARDHAWVLHDAGCPAEHAGARLIIFPQGRWER
jgi:hypothetical protein